MNAVPECEVCHSPLNKGAGECTKCLLSLAMEEPIDPEPITVERSRAHCDFELLEQIGHGGMGVVYRARQRSLNREVAIKKLLPGPRQSGERFRIEAEAGAKLQHPNIVPIYEIGGEADGLYLCMQLVGGGNLKQRFDQLKLPPSEKISSAAKARLRQGQIATFLGKLARAVHFAHERGVLHRDLKPENILVREDGEPMLTDFGLAKIWDHEQSPTGSGQVFGTLNYMAPEQASGGRVSRAADIFSLGAILYELLTGTTPFRAATPAQTLRQLAEDDALNPKRINKWVDADLAMVCSKCLQKDYKDRYATAEELADDLDRWKEGKPVHARPLPPRVRVQRWVRRNRAVTALLALLVLGLTTTLLSLVAEAKQKRAKEIALEALRGSVGSDIYQAWSPRGYVEITSEQLAALLGGEPGPLSVDHTRLKLAVFVHQNPMETVGQYWHLIPYLEREIERETGRPIRFDLWLYKEFAVESLREKANIVRVSPLFYAEAKRFGLELQPLVRQKNSTMRGVIFSRRNLSLQRLADLENRSLMFGEPNSTVTFEAQRVLALAGLTQKNLSNCGYVIPSPSSAFNKGGYMSRASEPLNAVKAGTYDAGVGLERQVEQTPHQSELNVIARFECPSPFWACTEGIDAKIISGFITAMEKLVDPLVLRSLPDDPQQPHAFVRTTAAEYASIEDAEREVSRFRGGLITP